MKTLVKILNFVKVVLGFMIVLGFILAFGLVGGIENGEPLLQGIVYIILSFTMSVLSFFCMIIVNNLIEKIVKKNSELQLKYYVN